MCYEELYKTWIYDKNISRSYGAKDDRRESTLFNLLFTVDYGLRFNEMIADRTLFGRDANNFCLVEIITPKVIVCRTVISFVYRPAILV